jgi:hypothetical protein
MTIFHIRTVQLAFLATMNAAILAISPLAPPLASSVWLGAAGLSVCGLFIVQYLSMKAFSISDADMGELVKDGRHINTAMLATAVASPVIFALWSSILFAVGIVDYVIENYHGGPQYKLVSLVPIYIGFMASAAVMILGSVIARRVNSRVSSAYRCFHLLTLFLLHRPLVFPDSTIEDYCEQGDKFNLGECQGCRTEQAHVPQRLTRVYSIEYSNKGSEPARSSDIRQSTALIYNSKIFYGTIYFLCYCYIFKTCVFRPRTSVSFYWESRFLQASLDIQSHFRPYDVTCTSVLK